MSTAYFRSVQSETLKLRRSLASWLVLAGGLFIPLIIFAARFHKPALLPAMYRAPDFWQKHWVQSWESLSIMILPMMIILLTALVAQLEFRNNSWKQLHASPQRPATIFFAKLTVVLVLVVALLAVITAGVYFSGTLPAQLTGISPSPVASYPGALFLTRNVHYFIDALPVVAMQFLLAIHFRNVLVPLGVGLALWLFSVGFLNSSLNYLLPFGYAAIDYLVDAGYRDGHNLPASTRTMALAWSAAITLLALVMYTTKGDRG